MRYGSLILSYRCARRRQFLRLLTSRQIKLRHLCLLWSRGWGLLQLILAGTTASTSTGSISLTDRIGIMALISFEGLNPLGCLARRRTGAHAKEARADHYFPFFVCNANPIAQKQPPKANLESPTDFIIILCPLTLTLPWLSLGLRAYLHSRTDRCRSRLLQSW